MNRIKIRRAQISDAEVVAHLWHNYDLYEHHLDKRIEVVSEISYEKQFLEIMQNESSIVVLAECDSAEMPFHERQSSGCRHGRSWHRSDHGTVESHLEQMFQTAAVRLVR